MSFDCLNMDEASAPQIECLPDEILVEILSRMGLKGAGRTSVLSRRWRYLWSSSLSLCFDLKDDDDHYHDFVLDDDPTTAAMVCEKFRGWVNRVLELHQAPQLDKFIVRFRRWDLRADEVDRWVDFAMRKEVKEFELKLLVTCKGRLSYECPNTEKYAFGNLRSLKLKFVEVEDEVVHNILASCPYLEALVIVCSYCTRNLQIFDPLPNLKHLEITYCIRIQSLEVSVMSLESFIYYGCQTDRPQLKNIPNLSEVSLGGEYASSFFYEGDRHSSYSAQLVKISLRIEVYQRPNHFALPRLDSLKRLELDICPQVGESLLFFTLLSKAAPLLCQFKIRLDYIVNPRESKRLESSQPDSSFPEVCAAESTTFHHENLKLVVMTRYIGCPSEDEFLQQLCRMAPSLEKVVIDTFGFRFFNPFTEEPVPYHKLIVKETGASTRAEAMERAKNLKLGVGGNMIMSSIWTRVIWQVETNGKTSNGDTDLNTSYVPGIENTNQSNTSYVPGIENANQTNTSCIPGIENANQTNSCEPKSTHKPQLHTSYVPGIENANQTNTSYVPGIENANQTNSCESKSTHKPQLQALTSAIFKFSVMILGFWVAKRHFHPSKKAKVWGSSVRAQTGFPP